jgi:hypothetical protein
MGLWVKGRCLPVMLTGVLYFLGIDIEWGAALCE